MGLKTKALVKTLSGTSAETLGTGLIPSTALIKADSGDTVYIGDSTLTGSSNGFLIPTDAPMKLSELFNLGNLEYYDLSQCYVQGASSDVVRLLWAARSK